MREHTNYSKLDFLKTRFTPWGIAALSGIVLCFLWLTLTQASSAYVIDEAAFPFAANGVLSHGAPIFYNGETRPQDLGLWHPPLYIYTLAGHISVFGFNPLSVRFYGILCVLFALPLLYIGLKLVSAKSTQVSVVVTFAIFLLNPLIVSGAVVPDIDGTIGIFSFSAVVLISILILKFEPSAKLLIIASFAMFLVISTKFTIALLGVLLIGLSALLSQHSKLKKLLLVFASTVIGTTTFFVIYSLLSLIPGFVFSGPFDYFFGSLGQRKSLGSGIAELVSARLFEGPGSVVYWLTPGLFIALIVCSVLLFIRKDPSHKREVILLFTGTTVVLFAYAFITSSPFGFPKYWGLVVIPASILIGVTFEGFERNSERTSRSRIIFAAIVSIGLVFFLALAYQTISQTTVETGRSLPMQLVYFFIFALFIFLIAYLLNWRKNGINSQQRLTYLLATSLVCSAVGVSGVVDFVNARAQYSTRYYFSEVGMNQLVSYLRSEIPEDSVLFVGKDVGIQSGHKFVEDAQWLFLTPQELEQQLLNSDVEYWVSRTKWDYSEPSFPEHFALLKQYFAPVANQPSPDFVVWKRK